MVKLYGVVSNVKGFLHCESVRFSWYCKDREKPAFPYEEVIMDYDKLNQNEKTFMERKIDEYFTETEITELREYLHRVYELDLEARRIQLPIILPHEDEFPLMEPEFLGLFSLYKDDLYNLSMRVVADYYLTHAFSISHDHLPTIHRKNGEMFANALLKKLSLCPPTNLEKAVEEIYGESCLIVTKG